MHNDEYRGKIMITKSYRHGKEDLYDLKVTDKHNNSFMMTVGGNLDLYWMPENYDDIRSFEIDKEDELLFTIFGQLFEAIKKNDNKYRPVLKGNTVTFISEEYSSEEKSNRLEITRRDKAFIIDFIKIDDDNDMLWSFSKGCPICFCNSGSRVPEVEILFMKMFNYLAYNCDQIQTIEDPLM